MTLSEKPPRTNAFSVHMTVTAQLQEFCIRSTTASEITSNKLYVMLLRKLLILFKILSGQISTTYPTQLCVLHRD